jgi:hypothetical protein
MSVPSRLTDLSNGRDTAKLTTQGIGGALAEGLVARGAPGTYAITTVKVGEFLSWFLRDA